MTIPHREHDFDRAGFGESSLPIWSALTPPERRALEGRERAAAGDPAALLDLAILASGGPRSAEAYDSIHRRVEAFVARKRPRYSSEPSGYKRAMFLHQAMHEEFFLQRPVYLSQEGVGPGYDIEQSALAPIFSEGRFNCVSSAILYVILARHFGFKARGVLLPTHAFAEIELSGGKVIEVETTHPGGFGARHDRAFYSRRGPGWFQSRGLAPSTYEDYLARRIVEPLALIAFNMNNQHAAPARTKQIDICRLKEAQAYLGPGDRDAQFNRLVI